MPSIHLLIFLHLVWTAVLLGLTLALNRRFRSSETSRWFRITLALLAATAVAPFALFWRTALLWVAPVSFAAATIAFVVFGIAVIRTRVDQISRRPASPSRGGF